MDFAILAGHRVKVKKKKTKILIRALETVSKGFVRRLEELEIGRRAKTIQTTALLKSARILSRVQDTRDLLSLRLQWKTLS